MLLARSNGLVDDLTLLNLPLPHHSRLQQLFVPLVLRSGTCSRVHIFSRNKVRDA